jgi:hypothetical protein
MTMNERSVISGGIKKTNNSIKTTERQQSSWIPLGKPPPALRKIKTDHHWKAEKPIFRFNKEILERLIEDCKTRNLGLAIPDQITLPVSKKKKRSTDILTFSTGAVEEKKWEVFIRPEMEKA